MFPCATAIGCGYERWVIPMAFVFFLVYIQSNLCTLFLKLGSHLLAYVLFLRHYRYVISEVQIHTRTVLLLPDDALLWLVHGSAHDPLNPPRGTGKHCEL